MPMNAAEKEQFAALQVRVDAQDLKIQTLQGALEEVFSRLAAREAVQSRPAAQKEEALELPEHATPAQKKALKDWGVNTEISKAEATKFLTECEKLLRDLGIKRYRCGNKQHNHIGGREKFEEAKACAMGQPMLTSAS